MPPAPTATCDTLVIGTGAIGSAACLALARRGQQVIGLDRFPPGHDRGSSHGQTRVIRKAYFEHADYVPLLERAYRLWDALADDAGEELFVRTGVLGFGPADGELVPGITGTAAQHGLQVETCSAAEAMARWPAFRAPEHLLAVFEPDAGYLFVERAIRAQARLAAAAGADLRHGISVHRWQDHGDHMQVHTDAGVFAAQQLVITAGAWATDLLADLGVPFRVLRKHLHWFATDDRHCQQDNGCPVFFFERPEGVFYGFPAFDGLGVKISEHSGGEEISDPLALDRSADSTDDLRIRGCLRDHLPGVRNQRTRHEACMYTMTPDEHFVVGRHPDHERVALVAGLSGHGFKFAPALGAVLADLVCDGQTALPIGFLAPGRFRTRR